MDTTVRTPVGSSNGSAPPTYEARLVLLDQFLQIVGNGSEPVPKEAPVAVAHDTLKDLAKTFGKDSRVLKNVAKTEDKLGGLPSDAIIRGVLESLRS